MCTVTYMPKENGDFILTQNRDEDIKRAIATPPIERTINGVKHLFPIDPQGGGTWIGISETGRMASLLNGGNEPHKHDPPYRHSRGKVILDYFNYETIEAFYENYDFSDLEPFTLLLFEEERMFELIVNESGSNLTELNTKKPYMYSSSSLYSMKSSEDRRLKYFEWYYKDQNNSQEDALNFHKKFLFEDEEDKSKILGEFILNTVSITSIHKSAKSATIYYTDQINDIQLKKILKLKKPMLEHSVL